MLDSLLFKTYIIERKISSFNKLPLEFKDSNNNVILTAGIELTMPVSMTIKNPARENTICTITESRFSVPPQFEIHEGDSKGNIIGIIKRRANLGGLLERVLGVAGTLDIADGSGNMLASVTGDFMTHNYTITDKNDNIVANISPDIGGSVGSMISGSLKHRYSLNITDNSKVSTLDILSCIVVIELLTTN